MSSLKKIGDRIHSIDSTRQITGSMKVVAVSRLKKKHAAFLETIPFADEMNRVMRRLVRSMKQDQADLIWENKREKLNWPALLNGNGREQRYMVAMVTSDDGLSGAASLQVVLQVQKVINYLMEQGKDVFVIAYGARGADILKRFFPNLGIVMIRSKKAKELNGYMNAEKLTADIIQSFHQNRFDVCLVVYNQFRSIVSQVPIVEQIIPNKTFLRENPWSFLIHNGPDYIKQDPVGQKKVALKKSSFLSAIGGVDVLSSLKGAIFKTDLSGGKRSPYVYDYEPSNLNILESLLPRYLTAYIYRVILESEVSDNAARLMAMDNATRNAGDILTHLGKVYRRSRQTRITTDIAEVSVAMTQESRV